MIKITFWRKILYDLQLQRTADDVAAVVLVPVPYVQQQVGAVQVGPVSWLEADHRLISHLLAVPVKVQLPHTTNDARGNKKVRGCNSKTDKKTEGKR